MGGKKVRYRPKSSFAAIFMDICKYWYKNWTAKVPVKVPVSTKDKEEFEIFKTVYLRSPTLIYQSVIYQSVVQNPKTNHTCNTY